VEERGILAERDYLKKETTRSTESAAVITDLVVDVNGETMAVCKGKLIDLFSLDAFDAQRRFQASGDVTSVAFLDQYAILAGSAADGTITLWNMKTGERIRSIRADPRVVEGMSVSPDGKLIATTGSLGEVKVWRWATGEEAAVFSGHMTATNSVSWFPDGKRLVSSSRLSQGDSGLHEGEIMIWSVPAVVTE
jgi:WD40 repeat protein